MKNASLLLVPFALGCSAVSSPDLSTSSDRVEVQAPRYREVDRVFDHLDAADLGGCRATFRFLNGNWIDCVVDLDASAVPLQQLWHETLPIRSFSFPTTEPDVALEVRVEEETTWSSSPKMRLFVSATYKKAGEIMIHQMSAEHYSCERFLGTVTETFAKLSRDDTYASRMLALSDPDFAHPLATDRVRGDLYVGRRTALLRAAGCESTYFNGMSDSWPDPDHWIAYCTITTPGTRAPVPLAKDHWSARLTKLTKAEPIVVPVADADARPGTTPTVTITYGDGGYTFEFAVIDDATKVPEDASIPWERAEVWLAKALAKVHEVTWPVLLKETELSSLHPGERIDGRLVLRDAKMDIE